MTTDTEREALNNKLASARDVFHALPSVTTAQHYREASRAMSQRGGTPCVWPWIVERDTAAIMAAWLAAPDGSADCTIELRISGNSLVSLLNVLDSWSWQRKEAGLLHIEESSDMRHAIEAIRDALSAQRCDKRKAG